MAAVTAPTTGKPACQGKIIFSGTWDGVLKSPEEINTWEWQIKVAMRSIQRTRCGVTLINAINATNKIMVIVPDPGKDINAETQQTYSLKAIPRGLSLVDAGGRPLGRTVGGGSCSIIRITPTNYAVRSGVFSSADTGLFHEMCHGLHMMLGQLMSYLPLEGDFDNMDEFWAIVLTNIYMSEKKYPRLRRDHHGREQLDADLSTSKAFYEWASTPIKQLCTSAPAFTLGIGRIEAVFNPIRYYYRDIMHAIP